MSVSATTTSVSYTGDGSVTSFAVTFAFQGTGSASELTVVERTIAAGIHGPVAHQAKYDRNSNDRLCNQRPVCGEHHRNRL